MVNIYQQISRNKIRSSLIIFLFVGFISIVSYIIAYSYDLVELFPLAVLFSFGSAFLSYYYGDKIVLSLNQAIPATREKYFDFYTVTENICLAANLPVPQIYVIPSPAMNAFATGRDPNHAVICATTGLLEKLDRTELEGVVAHELSHIKNYDILLMTIVSILIGTLSILIDMAQHSVFHRKNDEKSSSSILTIIGLILIIFAPLIGQLIQLAISRRREFFADAQAVMLTRQPSGLINALKKISADPNIFKTASTATASLYIANPFTKNKIANLFSTHPPVADRIKALEGMM